MNEKQGLLMLSGYYVGKEFVKQGVKKKDGSPYTMFKLLIKTKMEDQYPKKLTMFDGLKGIDTVAEGNYVVVGYRLSEPFYSQVANKTIQTKTAAFIQLGDPNNPVMPPAQAQPLPQQVPQQQVVGQQPVNVQATATPQQVQQLQAQGSGVQQSIQQFIAQYITQTAQNGTKVSKAHFVGCYVLNNMPDAVKELIQAYEATWKE